MINIPNKSRVLSNMIVILTLLLVPEYASGQQHYGIRHDKRLARDEHTTDRLPEFGEKNNDQFEDKIYQGAKKIIMEKLNQHVLSNNRHERNQTLICNRLFCHERQSKNRYLIMIVFVTRIIK